MLDDIERCPICGSHSLARYGSRPHGQCANCHAKERTRTIYLLFDKLGLFKNDYSMLHIAPERSLSAKLFKVFGDRYMISDIRADAFEGFDVDIKKGVMDITNISSDMRNNRFDIILHSHVMEHVRASWQLTFLSLHAMLNPNGWHIFSLPIKRDWSSEQLLPMSPEKRARRFGQHDHFRYIGRNDFEIDMRAISELTKSGHLIRAMEILGGNEMARISGDPDVYVLRRSGSADHVDGCRETTTGLGGSL